MANTKKQTTEQISHEHRMRRILGITVLSVTAIIVFLWGFAFRNRLVNYSWNQSDEKALFESAQANWQNARALTQTNDYALDEAKEEVRQTLTAILSEHLSASSTATSTETADNDDIIVDTTTTTNQ